MIRLKNILQLWRDTLSADAALSAWCLATYSSPLKIFIGIDHQDEPGQADCPLVILHPATASEGQTASMFVYRLLVNWAVVDPAKTDDGNTTEYGGIYRLDDMGQLIWEALIGASSNVSLSSREYMLEPVEEFPLLIGGMDITVEVPHVIGGAVTL